MSYNLVFEGCDCVGKTSIINAFIKRNPDYRYYKIRTPQNYVDGLNINVDFVNMLNKNRGLVCDRGVLGEAVYGPIMRGYYPDYIRDLEKKLCDHNVLVLVDADSEIVKSRFDGEFIKTSDIEKILICFKNEFLNSNWPLKIYLNNSVGSINRRVNLLEKFIKAL